MAVRLTHLLGREKWLKPPVAPWAEDAGLRPRVLLECPPEGSPWIVASVLEREGFEVAVCEGPTPRHRCPLAHDQSCPALDGADVVLSMLDRRRVESAEVLPAMMACAPNCPPVVVHGRRDEFVPDGVATLGPRSSVASISTTLRRAIERARPT